MYTNCNACGFPAEGPPADDRQCPECGREAQDPWPVVLVLSAHPGSLVQAVIEPFIGPVATDEQLSDLWLDHVEAQWYHDAQVATDPNDIPF